jgi:hypothetical protein
MTESLLQFLKKEGLFTKADEQKDVHFSVNTTKMFTRLLEQIADAEKAASAAVPEIAKTARKINPPHFPRSADFDYFPQPVCQSIHSMTKAGYIYTFTVKKRTYEVAMMCSAKKTGAKAFCEGALSKIYQWLYVADRHASCECSQKMNIYLYFTELKKEIPTEPGQYISQQHINTAFTTSCDRVTELNLSREEEWFKVFIHETFHNMGLDFSEMNAAPANQHILSYFPVKSDVRLFETYCEMWAEIINVLFCVQSENYTAKQQLHEVKKRLSQERAFSLFQCAKILRYYGLEYHELHDSHSQEARLRKYKEKTHVLSYFIIKSIFFFFLDEYVEWCVKHNGLTLRFDCSEKTVTQYCNLVGKLYRSPVYTETLGDFERWFSRLKEYSPFEIKTLRMTLYG